MIQLTFPPWPRFVALRPSIMRNMTWGSLIVRFASHINNLVAGLGIGVAGVVLPLVGWDTVSICRPLAVRLRRLVGEHTLHHGVLC